MNTEIYKKAIEFYAVRGSSHGMGHISRVVERTMWLCEIIQLDSHAATMAFVVALVHDMIDKKYPQDADRGARLIKEICREVNINEDLVLDIVKRVSFSEEKTNGKAGWSALLGSDGLIVRNIVSDADKLDALGINGLERCKDYIRETWPEISEKEVDARLRDHCDKKLFLLPAHLVHFDSKEVAAYLILEMRAALKQPLNATV